MNNFRVLEIVTICKEYEVKAKDRSVAINLVQWTPKVREQNLVRTKTISTDYETENLTLKGKR